MQVLYEYNTVFKLAYYFFAHTYISGMKLRIKGRVKKRKKDRTLKLLINHSQIYGNVIKLSVINQNLIYGYVPAITRSGVFGIKGYFLLNNDMSQ